MLKTLMLRRDIDRKKKMLDEIRAKDPDFLNREAELEKDINETETDEQREAVGEEVEKFEDEKAAHEQAKEALSNEIADLEGQLAEAERSAPNPTIDDKKKNERKNVNMSNINIRSLPKSQRAFDALPMQEREEIINRGEVKEFLTRMRSFKGQTRDITGGELTIPVIFLDLVAENMYRYSKLLNRVRVRNVRGQARQTIAGLVPEAVWTEMCAAINELTFKFNQISVDGYKVAGFVPVCNSLLEDSDIDLASWIVEMLSESIGLAMDKAILYGKGAAFHMPQGIVTRLAQSSKPSGYPANAPEWVDLHTTNLVTIDASLTGAAFWAALQQAAGKTFTRYSRGELFWAMNSKTYALLKSKAITFTASGDVVANVYGLLPIITGDIDVLEFMPDGDIIGGYGDLYLLGQRSGMTIEASREVQFIQDNTVFKAKMRADGCPIIAGAFVGININGSSVTTTMTFAADTANDASLQGLTVGALSLSPAFAADTETYTASAANNVASAAVTATPAQAGAEIGITVTAGTTTKNVVNGGTAALAVGENVVKVTVKQGDAVRVYSVTVTRAAS